MAKEFTDGFDLKATVPERFLSTLASRLIRRRRTKTVHWLGLDHLLEVYFHLLVPKAPVLGAPVYVDEGPSYAHAKVLPAEGNLSFVELRFPFRAIVRTLGFEKTAQVRAVVTTKMVSTTDGEGRTSAQLVVDLSQLSTGDFDFHPDLGSITWSDQEDPDGSTAPTWLMWKAHTRFPQALFEQEVEPLVIDALRMIKEASITPSTRSFEYIAFRTYAAGAFLGVFANTTATSSPPAPPLTFSMPPLAAHEPSATNMHVLVPAETVNPILEEQKEKAVVKAQEDHNVDVQDFALELKNGYILATGHAKGVDFEAELALSVHQELDPKTMQMVTVITAQELALNVDLGWWADLVQFFPVGSILIQAIREAAIKALGEAVDDSSGAAFPIEIFDPLGREIPIQELPGAEATVIWNHVAEGPITIRSSGLAIPGQLSAVATAPVEWPPRAFAHRRSREFHHTDCGQFHMKLAAANVVVFPNEAAALQQGFNGCVYCHPEYHLEDLDYGYVKVRVRFTDPTASQLEVGLWLERVEPLSVHDVTVTPSSRLTAHHKFSPAPGAHVMAVPLDLFAGTWKLKVTRGEWSSQCEVDVPPRKGRKYVRVTIEVGAAECDIDELTVPPDTPMAIGKLRP